MATAMLHFVTPNQVHKGDTVMGMIIQNGKQYFPCSMNNVYSTEEQEVGTWYDGKQIYKRSYPLQSSKTLGGGNNYITEVDNLSEIYAVIDAVFTVKNSGILRIYCVKSSSGVLIKTQDTGTVPAGSVLTLLYTKE